jgi:hypothetical protein
MRVCQFRHTGKSIYRPKRMSLPIAAPSDDRGFPPDLAIAIYSGDGLCVQRDRPGISLPVRQ